MHPLAHDCLLQKLNSNYFLKYNILVFCFTKIIKILAFLATTKNTNINIFLLIIYLIIKKYQYFLYIKSGVLLNQLLIKAHQELSIRRKFTGRICSISIACQSKRLTSASTPIYFFSITGPTWLRHPLCSSKSVK